MSRAQRAQRLAELADINAIRWHGRRPTCARSAKVTCSGYHEQVKQPPAWRSIADPVRASPFARWRGAVAHRRVAPCTALRESTPTPWQGRSCRTRGPPCPALDLVRQARFLEVVFRADRAQTSRCGRMHSFDYKLPVFHVPGANSSWSGCGGYGGCAGNRCGLHRNSAPCPPLVGKLLPLVGWALASAEASGIFHREQIQGGSQCLSGQASAAA